MVIHYTLEVLSEWNRLQESLHANPIGSEWKSIRSLWVPGNFESSMSNDHAWPCRLDMSNACVNFRWKLMWTEITANSSRTGRSVCHVSWFASWTTKTPGELDLFVRLLNSRNFPFLSASALQGPWLRGKGRRTFLLGFGPRWIGWGLHPRYLCGRWGCALEEVGEFWIVKLNGWVTSCLWACVRYVFVET